MTDLLLLIPYIIVNGLLMLLLQSNSQRDETEITQLKERVAKLELTYAADMKDSYNIVQSRKA